MKLTKLGIQTLSVVATTTAFFFSCVAAQAATMSYGPTAYVQTGDTPSGFWDGTLGAATAWIEDFELGTLDTFLSIDNGSVLPPSSYTDSVDGDNGSVDGNGNSGYSWFAAGANNLTVTFGAGGVRAAGLVFTDGDSAATSFTLEAFDTGGASLGVINAGDLGDNVFNGTTGEDRFLGFTDDMTAIGSITLAMNAGDGMEIDHIHWQGVTQVPEPATHCLALFAVVGLIGLRRSRK